MIVIMIIIIMMGEQPYIYSVGGYVVYIYIVVDMLCSTIALSTTT